MVIYKTTNLVNGKIYIGQYTKNDKNYIGSGKLLKLSVNKYGKNNFIRENIFICKTQNQLDLMEKFFIKKFNSTNLKIGYNILSGASKGKGGINPMKIKECRDSMILKKKGVSLSDEHKNKIRISLKGRKCSKEHIEKVRIANSGKKFSDNTRLKMSLAQMNRIESNETKMNKSISAKLAWIKRKNKDK